MRSILLPMVSSFCLAFFHIIGCERGGVTPPPPPPPTKACPTCNGDTSQAAAFPNTNTVDLATNPSGTTDAGNGETIIFWASSDKYRITLPAGLCSSKPINANVYTSHIVPCKVVPDPTSQRVCYQYQYTKAHPSSPTGHALMRVGGCRNCDVSCANPLR